MLAWIAANHFMLCGIILMLAIGPAVGNYACSVVYRLPRGKTPFERHPYCGHCNADLKPIDLFPSGHGLAHAENAGIVAVRFPAFIR